MDRKNGLVEVSVGPPVFTLAMAPLGSPKTWNFGMTILRESLNARPAATAISTAKTEAIRSVRLTTLCLAGVGLGGWTSWGAIELEPAGIRVPFEPSVITLTSFRKLRHTD
jgi:hypothetical protein